MADNCTECSLTPDDKYADKLENRILRGEELIYYTKKIQQEIAAAGQSSEEEADSRIEDLKTFIQEQVSAIESNADGRKDEIKEHINNVENAITETQTQLETAKNSVKQDVTEVKQVADAILSYARSIPGIEEKLGDLDTLKTNLDAAVEELLDNSESKFTSLAEAIDDIKLVIPEHIDNAKEAISNKIDESQQAILDAEDGKVNQIHDFTVASEHNVLAGVDHARELIEEKIDGIELDKPVIIDLSNEILIQNPEITSPDLCSAFPWDENVDRLISSETTPQIYFKLNSTNGSKSSEPRTRIIDSRSEDKSRALVTAISWSENVSVCPLISEIQYGRGIVNVAQSIFGGNYIAQGAEIVKIVVDQFDNEPMYFVHEEDIVKGVDPIKDGGEEVLS